MNIKRKLLTGKENLKPTVQPRGGFISIILTLKGLNVIGAVDGNRTREPLHYQFQKERFFQCFPVLFSAFWYCNYRTFVLLSVIWCYPICKHCGYEFGYGFYILWMCSDLSGSALLCHSSILYIYLAFVFPFLNTISLLHLGHTQTS